MHGKNIIKKEGEWIIEYSNDGINNVIKRYLQLENLTKLQFWNFEYAEDFKDLSDGYLGKVNQDIYQRLLIKLKKSDAWFDFH